MKLFQRPGKTSFSRSKIAAAVGSAVVGVLVPVLNRYAGIELPPDVVRALEVLFGFLVVVFLRDAIQDPVDPAKVANVIADTRETVLQEVMGELRRSRAGGAPPPEKKRGAGVLGAMSLGDVIAEDARLRGSSAGRDAQLDEEAEERGKRF